MAMGGRLPGRKRDGDTMSRKTGGTRAFLSIASLLVLVAPMAAGAATVESIAPDTVRGLIRAIEPAEGAVWAASDRGVYRIEANGRFARRFTAADGLPSNNVYTVSAYKGKVYAGTDTGLAVMEGGRWTAVGRILDVHLRRFVYTGVDPNANALYVSSIYVSGGLLSFDGEQWKFRGGSGYGRLNTIVAFGFAEKEAWLGTWNGVIYRMTEKGVDFFRAADGLPGNRVFCIKTSGRKVYVGTDSGVGVFEEGKWKTIDVSGILGSGVVHGLALSGETLFAGGPGGLARIAGSLKEGFEDPSGKTKGGVFSLAFVDGSLYAGTRDGLVAVKGWR